MTIGNGTTITIPSGRTVVVENGASVENDGAVILLGTATLEEEPGYPIFGSGTEQHRSFQGAGVSMQNMGGLGLYIDQSSAMDSLIITRGHLPLLDDIGSAGVARWYRVEADLWANGAAVQFFTDNSEFNGLPPNELVLFRSTTGSGWAYIPGSLGAGNLLTASPIDSIGYFTLFRDSTIADVAELRRKAVRLFPNPSNDHISVGGITQDHLPMQLLDTQGRIIHVEQRMTDRVVTLDIRSLGDGIYTIRFANGHSESFIKQ